MKGQAISVTEARRLIENGAVLVDVREAGEHTRERIPSAMHHALSRVATPLDCREASAIILHCRSGARAKSAAERFAVDGGTAVYVLEGGIEAWKAAGLPVTRDVGQPPDLMRQVQIAAGGLTVFGAILGFMLHPAFYAIAGAVGAGLLFAGLTGSCGLARLLALAPWNRRTTADAGA